MRLPYSSQNFSVQGLNLERFLNLLLQNDILLLHAERTDSRTLHCTCRSADFQNILAIAAQKGWCIQHTGAGGFSAVWKRVRKRPGIPIGILLMFVFLCTATRLIHPLRHPNTKGTTSSQQATHSRHKRLGEPLRYGAIGARQCD